MIKVNGKIMQDEKELLEFIKKIVTYITKNNTEEQVGTEAKTDVAYMPSDIQAALKEFRDEFVDVFEQLDADVAHIRKICELVQDISDDERNNRLPDLLGVLYKTILEYHADIDFLDVTIQALPEVIREYCNYTAPYIQIANEVSEFLRDASIDFLDTNRDMAEDLISA